MMNPQLIFPLYLFYGMAFLAIGVSITSRETSTSSLKIARPLQFFALFAYSHAFLEWFTLYLILYSGSFRETLLSWVNFVKLSLVFGSFGFLLLFGIALLRIVYPAWRRWFPLIPVLLVLIVLISLPLNDRIFSDFPFWEADIRIRNLIGFPSAMIASLGFILYSRTLRTISGKGARNFAGAGFALACYGVLTGLVPSGSMLPMFNAPVELFRGITAFVILHFIMNALHTFDVERELLIEERLNRFAQSEKLHSLGKLAFGIAHEINNPLGNVSINVELLKKDLQSKELLQVHEKRFATIERNLDRASKIAHELLSFSTNKESDHQSTDLNDTLRGTLALLGSRRKAYQIILNLKSIPVISGIPWKLEEVFLNIIINAMDALPAGGLLEITTAQKGDKVIVTIADNGPGISSEHISHVLDPFFTTKDVGNGTGLGLSICFGIMEMHGGTITLESPDGAGTTVSLVFPIGVEDNA